jgi:hypothetical protein
LGSCEKEIDAFRGQQHGPFQSEVIAHTLQHGVKRISVRQGDEPIPGDVGDRSRHERWL